MDWMTVSVDASASIDQNSPALALTYAWNFGDGNTAGNLVSTTHTYDSAGSYTITLTVTNTIPLSAQATQPVVLVDNGPTASFLISASGLTVNVDATGSSDDWGIASFTWNWNDGSALETYNWPTTTASHTYAVPAAAVAPAMTGKQAPPPYTIAGYCYDGDTTTKLVGCSVVVTDVTKGVSSPTLTSNANGYYSTNLQSWCPTYSAGDTIKVVADLGAKHGEATGIVSGAALPLNVRLYSTGPQPFEVTVTLTVTDTFGQIATVSKTIMLTPP
jgi:hypothetical protein